MKAGGLRGSNIEFSERKSSFLQEERFDYFSSFLVSEKKCLKNKTKRKNEKKNIKNRKNGKHIKTWKIRDLRLFFKWFWLHTHNP